MTRYNLSCILPQVLPTLLTGWNCLCCSLVLLRFTFGSDCMLCCIEPWLHPAVSQALQRSSQVITERYRGKVKARGIFFPIFKKHSHLDLFSSSLLSLFAVFLFVLKMLRHVEHIVLQ